MMIKDLLNFVDNKKRMKERMNIMLKLVVGMVAIAAAGVATGILFC